MSNLCYNKPSCIIICLSYLSIRKKAVAIFLINCGADVTTQARNGCTAFDMASLIGKFVNCLTKCFVHYRTFLLWDKMDTKCYLFYRNWTYLRELPNSKPYLFVQVCLEVLLQWTSSTSAGCTELKCKYSSSKIAT